MTGDGPRRAGDAPRRLIPRLHTDWREDFTGGDDAAGRWRDCRVIDISSAGARRDRVDTGTADDEGLPILVGLHVAHNVRNIRRRPSGPLWPSGLLRLGARRAELMNGHQANVASSASSVSRLGDRL